MVLPDLIQKDPRLEQMVDLRFRDPVHFVAGEIHNHLAFLEPMLLACPQRVFFSKIVASGVNIQDFLCPFTGQFRGQTFDSPSLPATIIPNARNCTQFQEFITNTVLDWIRYGSIAVWGQVDRCVPPHLVLPLTVESTKPRLCHDERFLNLWVKDTPFKLDYILPRYVLPGH